MLAASAGWTPNVRARQFMSGWVAATACVARWSAAVASGPAGTGCCFGPPQPARTRTAAAAVAVAAARFIHPPAEGAGSGGRRGLLRKVRGRRAGTRPPPPRDDSVVRRGRLDGPEGQGWGGPVTAVCARGP